MICPLLEGEVQTEVERSVGVEWNKLLADLSEGMVHAEEEVYSFGV